MTESVGRIKDGIEDGRSGKLVFLSHCMFAEIDTVLQGSDPSPGHLG